MTRRRVVKRDNFDGDGILRRVDVMFGSDRGRVVNGGVGRVDDGGVGWKVDGAGRKGSRVLHG